MGKKNKATYIEVAQLFMEKGCYLLEENYINSTTLMKYVCECGEYSRINFTNFINGHRCKQCGINKMSKTQRTTISVVNKLFEENDCVLLSTEYVNNKIPLSYICSCGNKSEISYSSFKRGRRCRLCGRASTGKKKRLSYEEVFNYFINEHCLLLDEDYKSNNTPMRYICQCGRESNTTFGNFKAGKRCFQCRIDRNSRENHHSWKGGISELDKVLRGKTSQWRKESIKSSNYKCEISGLDDALDVHHLYPFHKILKEFIEKMNIEVKSDISQYQQDELLEIGLNFITFHNNFGLGVALHESLHEEFHCTCGYIDFTPEDFEEFKQNKISELFTQTA